MKTNVPIQSGEIIEARQALFFIAVVLLVFSIYPLVTNDFGIGTIINLVFATSSLILGFWSKTNPVSAFFAGLVISILFMLLNGLILNILGVAMVGAFSLAFYRGWKQAKLQQQNYIQDSREDILDEGI
ncbi:MAG: hypothetical protein ACI8YQ_002303 [Polaribacter sp.]|jgi:hypothetical protein